MTKKKIIYIGPGIPNDSLNGGGSPTVVSNKIDEIIE